MPDPVPGAVLAIGGGLTLIHQMIGLVEMLPPVVGAAGPDNVTTWQSPLTVSAEVVLLQPEAVSVNVNVTLPAETAVTSPLSDTVATDWALLTHVPPDVGDKITNLLPKQIRFLDIETVGAASTVIVPVAFTLPQPPVRGMLYSKVPDAVGVPLMVIVLPAHVAETPAGKPFAPATPSLDMPCAPVVVCVMAVNTVLMQSGGIKGAAVTVFSELTFIDPSAFTLLQPPVNGML